MRSIFTLALLVSALALAPGSARAGYRDDIGFTKLQLELGGALATGAGVGVSQSEAPTNTTSPYDYLPDTTFAEFSGKTFVVASPAGGVSGHATIVGQYYYGSSTSIAPGVASIRNYEANDWIGSGFLNFGTLNVPKTETQKIENNSWVGGPPSSSDAEVLRRFDFAIQRDNFLAVSGLNNGSGTAIPPLMASAYNGLSVGLASGNHSSGQTTADGAGRIKPDLVCETPEDVTSFATPVVGAAAALLRQKALSDSTLNGAANSVALKSILMAGALKTGLGGSWSRPSNSAQPMDLHYGAGRLNIYNSYHILTAGQQAASNTATVRSRGWDNASTAAGGALYFFDLAPGDSFSNFTAVLTWNRVIANGFLGPTWGSSTSTLPVLSLTLSSASGFTVGAVVDSSVSTIDNVQLVFQPNLPPGRYALQVTSATAGVNYGLAWSSLPTVTIAATTAEASELGLVPGAFTVTRAGDTTDALTVNYTVSGTAAKGVDFEALPGAVTIPAGASSVPIPLTPLADTLAEGDETVTLTLAGDLAYSTGTADTATATLHDRPFDAWRYSHFTPEQINDPSPANITTATANPASDGLVNLAKYALNLDPLVPQTAGLPALSIPATGFAQFTFTRNLTAIDLALVVEACTDLTKPPGDPAGWQTIASFPAGASTWTTSGGASVSDTGGIVTVTDGTTVSAQPARFFRLRVILP